MFDIQDPRYENGKLLNEALLDACKNAVYGAGTYAFVSADGINLLMNNEIFKQFITQGEYFLIIGMDEITNTRTLATIQQFCIQYPNLNVKAFMHQTIGSTYHPKYSWFKYENGGMMVLGSGNLTAKGLRRNTEAFIVQKLDEEEVKTVENKWEDWVNSSNDCIKSLYDPEVILRAEENMKQVSTNTMKTEWIDENEAWRFDNNSEVLIAEIASEFNHKKNGFYQVEFDIHTGNSFFGADFSPKKDLVMRKITSQGSIKSIETKSMHFTANQKYQLEFLSHENAEKIEKGFPFVIFIKLAVRTFLYTIIIPDDRGYKQLKKQINNNREDLRNLARYHLNADTLINNFNSLAIVEYLSKSK